MAWPTKTDFVDGDVLTAAQVNNIGINLNLFNPTSATNGQVWKADGAGSGAYGAAPSSFTQVAAGNLPAASSLSITGIPATYRALLFLVFGGGTVSSIRMNMGFNNSSTNYTWDSQDNGTSTGGTGLIGATVGNALTNHNFAHFIYNYYQTGITTVYGWSVNGTNPGQFLVGRWNTTDVVTSIQLSPATGNFNAGTYQLWGIG